jgi:hypothetical protein
MYPLMGRLLVPSAGQSAGGGKKATLATLRGEKVCIHPHSINGKLHDIFRNNGGTNGANHGGDRDGTTQTSAATAPVLVCYDEATRGEALLYVRECTVVAAPALVLVASSLTVEPLPPVGSPEHDPEDPGEVAEATRIQTEAQRAQDATGDAVLVCDNWLRFRVPLAVLSQLACLRIRLARAFAAKVTRPGETLAADLSAALSAAATLLAHDGGAAGADDRGGSALGAGGYGQGFSGRGSGGGGGGGRPGDWQCPKGCGVVFANKSNCFRCGTPRGGGGGGRGGGGAGVHYGQTVGGSGGGSKP